MDKPKFSVWRLEAYLGEYVIDYFSTYEKAKLAKRDKEQENPRRILHIVECEVM